MGTGLAIGAIFGIYSGPLETAMPRNHLASTTAACCWIPLFALRCEEARRPEARDDSESGDRSLSLAPAVRARPGPLRRAVRAAAGRAERGEPGGGAGGAGGGIRRYRRLRGTVWWA